MTKKLLFGFCAPTRKSNTAGYLKLLTFIILSGIFNIGKTYAQVNLSYNNPATQVAATPAYANLPGGGRITIFSNSTVATVADDAVYAVPLPFDFIFNGICYASGTNIYASTNGFVTFGTTLPATTLTTPISAATAYAGAISAYGVDLRVVTASTNIGMFRNLTGTAGSQIMKIEWRSFERKAVATGAGLMSFQIWLYEGTNTIEIHYNGTSFSDSSPAVTGQIGLRGGTTATDFNNLIWAPLTFPNNWPGFGPGTQMAAGTSKTDAVRTRQGVDIVGASSNRTFRWTPTPICNSPSTVTASAITGTTATISWTAPCPSPASGYEYYYSTSAAPVPNGTAGTTSFGIATANLTSLLENTTYYVWVRANCGGSSYSSWVPGTFTTICDSQTPYYGEFFNPPPAVPAIPYCTTIVNVTGNNWRTWAPTGTSTTNGFGTNHLEYNQSGSVNANTWFFTKGLNLTAGVTYKLTYKYGGETFPSTLTNRLEVRYGTAPTVAAMNPGGVQLAIHPSIRSTPLTNAVNFTPASSGTYYIGFRAFSNMNNGTMYLDDVEVDVSTCTKPTGLALVAGTQTSSSQGISWTAPSPTPPAGGYAYYYSLVNSTPAYGTAGLGTVAPGLTFANVTGLNPGTQYYFWVRGICGTGDFSEWSAVIPFMTAAAIVYCTPAPSSVDGVGLVNVTMGSINNSTGAEGGNYGNYSNMITNVSQGTTVPISLTFNTGTFSYNTKIWIDWNNDGDFYDDQELVYTGATTPPPNPFVLSASFTVPTSVSNLPGPVVTNTLGQHRVRIGGADIDLLTGTGPGQGPCYNGTWATFEDYSIFVTTPPPALALNINSDTQCAGTNSALVTITPATVGNYQVYTWNTTSGVSGDSVSGYTFNPTSTTTYTLTATQTSSPFRTNTVSFTYNANPLPTPITISPTSATSCEEGPAVLLSASGGVVSGITILGEDFNGSAPGWTTSNTGTGGTNGVAYADFALRPDGWQPYTAGLPVTGSAWGTTATLHSNDNTQFFWSNADSQGQGGNNNAAIISPVFSLAGYTAASVNFYSFFQEFNTGAFFVELSLNGGATWPVGNILLQTAVNHGSLTNFVPFQLDLTPYVGQTNLRIRIRYTDVWGWGMAVDNFRISGSATSSITWAPTTGLYTDAAATTAYTGGGAQTIYAMPTITTIYTASASTVAPVCTTNTAVTVTVTPIDGGDATPLDQSVCSGLAGDITLGSYNGTITRWQSSTTSATAGFTDFLVTASPILTAAQIGNVTQDTWFRAVVTNLGCTAYSVPAKVTLAAVTYSAGAWSNVTGPTSTLTAIFAGNYSSIGNLTACAVKVNSGNVVINPGHTLTVENNVMVNGGSLTFENSASLMQNSTAVANTGNIVYRRNTSIRKFDYTYWSSPVFPQTLANLSPLTLSDKYWWFNGQTNTWINVANPAGTNMTQGQGYIIRGPQYYADLVTLWPTATLTPWTGEFSGVPNNGNYDVSVYMGGGLNLNLLGNPYPSAISANALMDGNAGPIGNPGTLGVTGTGTTFYFWTHNTQLSGNNYVFADYALYNRTGGTQPSPGPNNAAPSGIIGAGQGFMAAAIEAGNVYYTNSMRVASPNTQFFRQSELDRSRIWLNFDNGADMFKQILVGYVENATNDFEHGFDGKQVEAGNPVSFYSVVNNDQLAIQGRALPFDADDQVPLGYRTDLAATYNISLADVDGLFTNQTIYLEDKLLNVMHNLTTNPVYSFVTETGVFNDRFVLRYNDNLLSVNPVKFDENAVIVYKQNQDEIHIESSLVDMKSVEIFDVRGRLILSKNDINGKEAIFKNVAIANEVILVKITSTQGATVTKKIIF